MYEDAHLEEAYEDRHAFDDQDNEELLDWDGDWEEVLDEDARDWLVDCGADPDLVGEASKEAIKREVERQYEGGWKAFAATVML